MAELNLQLINLEGGGTFNFRFFPHTVRLTNHLNWERQNLTHAVKPLYYANQDPRIINFPELWMDTTDTNQDLRPQMAALEDLIKEIAGLGRPPKLLAVWGNGQELCVIEELEMKEVFHHREGYPLRVEVNLTLVHIQPG